MTIPKASAQKSKIPMKKFKPIFPSQIPIGSKWRVIKSGSYTNDDYKAAGTRHVWRVGDVWEVEESKFGFGKIKRVTKRKVTTCLNGQILILNGIWDKCLERVQEEAP